MVIALYLSYTQADIVTMATRLVNAAPSIDVWWLLIELSKFITVSLGWSYDPGRVYRLP
jgi:hypothetical protein